jgi:superfamily II DNA helicase RecQ
MQILHSGILPTHELLLHDPAGDGKSYVHDVHAVMRGGFSLTITPLVALGADQEEKITSKAKHTAGILLSIHLDEIWSLSNQEKLIKQLKLLPPDGHTTCMLFSSPQANCKRPVISYLWSVLMRYLFVHSGMCNRQEFIMISD